MGTLIPSRLLIWAALMLASATAFAGNDGKVERRGSRDDCSVQTETFPLRDQNLAVTSADGGILFTAGMTIDADGAPNAYGPHNHGLDYTANARGARGWAALVTNHRGRPLIQQSGLYRGYYISTTSLQQSNIRDFRDPRKYIDATSVPYIALPADFARNFNIHLGDLALVVNHANGRSAYAIFADFGPKGRIGEGSIALAEKLGIPANPRHDSVSEGVTYLIFPGSAQPAQSRITARRITTKAARIYHRWGGTERRHELELSESVAGFVPSYPACSE